MDDIVKRALIKWPNVPDCYGWLGLDARGNWYMRDAKTQSQGSFPRLGQAGVRGSCLQHEKLIAFIQRNYEVDPRGCWFFQNGPQRVYVEIEATPWIWRITPRAGQTLPLVTTHTGLNSEPTGCWVDELGHLYLSSPLGLGLVHTQDVHLAAEAIDAGWWEPRPTSASQLPRIFGYIPSPASLVS
jgi:hypothetical protein